VSIDNWQEIFASAGRPTRGGAGTIFGAVIGSILIGVITVLAVAFNTFAKSRRRRI